MCTIHPGDHHWRHQCTDYGNDNAALNYLLSGQWGEWSCGALAPLAFVDFAHLLLHSCYPFLSNSLRRTCYLPKTVRSSLRI